MLRVFFFGGQNEIGGNKILLDDGDTRLFLDFGRSFKSESDYLDQPFVTAQTPKDLLTIKAIPHLQGVYKNAGYEPMYDQSGFVGLCGQAEKRALDAILVSHAHVDHAGYLGLIRSDVKFFGSQITKAFLSLRREIHEDWTVKYDDDNFVGMSEMETVKIGNAEVTHIGVDHSIPGASAFIIKMGGLMIGYSGDLRLHGRRPHLTQKFMEETKNAQLDYLFCEGTRIGDGHDKADLQEEQIERKSLGSEEAVAGKLADVLDHAKGIVIYDGSPADLDRMEMVIEVARQKGRKVLIDSKRAFITQGINLQAGHYPNLANFDDCMLLLSRKKATSSRKGLSAIMEEELKPKSPRKPKDLEKESMKQAILEALDICPDMYIETRIDGRFRFEKDIISVFDALPQNEELPRVIWGKLREEVKKHQDEYLIYTSLGPLTMMHMGEGLKGTYVYGKAEPFSEEMEISFKKLLGWNKLYGMEFEYAHTSGHANKADLGRIIGTIKPKFLLPMHTEHADIFKDLYDKVELFPTGAVVVLTKDGPTAL